MAQSTSTVAREAKSRWRWSKSKPKASPKEPNDLPDNLRAVAYAIGSALRVRVLRGSDVGSIRGICNAVQRITVLEPRYRFQFARDLLTAVGEPTPRPSPSPKMWEQLRQDALVARVLVELSRAASWTKSLSDNPPAAEQASAVPAPPDVLRSDLAIVDGQIRECLEVLANTAILNCWSMPSGMEADPQECHDVTAEAVGRARAAMEGRRSRLIAELERGLDAGGRDKTARARRFADVPVIAWRNDMKMAFEAIATELGSRQQAKPFKLPLLYTSLVRRHKVPPQRSWSGFGSLRHGAIATALGTLVGAIAGWGWTASLAKDVAVTTATSLGELVGIYGAVCGIGAVAGGAFGLGIWSLARRSKKASREAYLTVLVEAVARMEEQALDTFSKAFAAYYGQLAPYDFFRLQHDLELRMQFLIMKLEDQCSSDHRVT